MFDDEKYFKAMCHLIDFFHEKLNVTWDCVCLKPNRRKDFGAEPIDSSHTAQKLYLQQKQHTLSDRISFAH